MTSPEFRVHVGDCRKMLPTLPADSFDAVATDPPYELGFMGKDWDKSGVAFDPATWAAVLRVLKPGGYMVAMGGSRTHHRLMVAIEDAGFEIRDCLSWLYGSGFPKGHGCLKPAWEPIVLARKPGPRVLPLGVDECRIPTSESTIRMQNDGPTWEGKFNGGRRQNGSDCGGRWPANVVHDGSEEVLEAFAAFGNASYNKAGAYGKDKNDTGSVYGGGNGVPRNGRDVFGYGDTGTAARFYYCAKASAAERAGCTHPTMKPVALMEWLVRLVCPPGGRLLDPFGGSGTTGVAGRRAGRAVTLVELDSHHAQTIARRIDAAAWQEDAGAWGEPDFSDAPPLKMVLPYFQSPHPSR